MLVYWSRRLARGQAALRRHEERVRAGTPACPRGETGFASWTGWAGWWRSWTFAIAGLEPGRSAQKDSRGTVRCADTSCRRTRIVRNPDPGHEHVLAERQVVVVRSAAAAGS